MAVVRYRIATVHLVGSPGDVRALVMCPLERGMLEWVGHNNKSAMSGDNTPTTLRSKPRISQNQHHVYALRCG